MTAWFLLVLSCAWISTIEALAQSRDNPVVIGESVRLESKILKESRSLLIARPDGYDSGTDRYPVLYLLDGETHFPYTAAIVRFLAGNDRIPKMLVVGVVSEDRARRTRDLTPPSTSAMDNRFSPGNGGAAAFLSFLADEAVPYVDKTYRTRPYRMLAGHSFGGLFAVYTLVQRPTLFQSYIAADPSLYWNDDAVATQAASFLSSTKALQADFYMTSAADSGKLISAIGKAAPAGFRWHFEWMKQEDHNSIPLPSIYRGLESVFEDWRLPDPMELFAKGGIEAIHSRFRDAGKRFGFPERTTPPFTVSLVVAALLRAGRLEDASSVLLHDLKTYPPPWNQLDALARAFESRGDAEKAARYYLQSLKENPRNEFARDKLTAMGVKIQ